MIRVCLLAIMGVGAAVWLRRERPEQAFALVTVTGILILMCALSEFYYLREMLATFLTDIPVEGNFMEIVMKMLGVSLCGGFSAEICKDHGFGAVAEAVDFLAKLIILTMGMPLLQYIVEMIGQYV